MYQFLQQICQVLSDYVKNILSKTYVTIGAPITGAGIGKLSEFLAEITPIVSFVAMTTGIVLGILSYRLKLKQTRKNENST